MLSAARLDGPAVIADTGYYNRTDIKNCIDDDMTVYIKKAKANNRTKDNEFLKEKFTCKAEMDIYICPRRYAPISSTVIPSVPGVPLFAFILLKALLRLPLSSPSINRTKTRYPFGSTPVKFSFL